jgi:hypothetical protein
VVGTSHPLTEVFASRILSEPHFGQTRIFLTVTMHPPGVGTVHRGRSLLTIAGFGNPCFDVLGVVISDWCYTYS